MRRRRRKKNKKILIYIRFILIILILLVIIHVVRSSQAKYKSNATSEADVDLAYFLVKPTSVSQTIKIDSILPSDNTTYTYDFTVSNFDGNKRTDTALNYSMKLKTTTNLHLNYSVHKKNQSTELITSSTPVQDSNGTYFLNMDITGDSLGFSSNETDEYELEIEFPTTPKVYSTAEYEGVIEYIELTVNAQQRIQ